MQTVPCQCQRHGNWSGEEVNRKPCLVRSPQSSKKWSAFQLNVREERSKMEEKFYECTVRGDTQFNNGKNFNDNENAVKFFIAFEDVADTPNKSADEERGIPKEKFARDALFKQSQLECKTIEEELFIKTSSENDEGHEVFKKTKTQHTNYHATSFTRRIEILLKFFNFGKYSEICRMFDQVRLNSHFMMKSEYSTLKDMIITAYHGFVEAKTIQQPIQINPIMGGHGPYGIQCPNCGQIVIATAATVVPNPIRSRLNPRLHVNGTPPLAENAGTHKHVRSCMFLCKKTPLPNNPNLTPIPITMEDPIKEKKKGKEKATEKAQAKVRGTTVRTTVPGTDTTRASTRRCKPCKIKTIS